MNNISKESVNELSSRVYNNLGLYMKRHDKDFLSTIRDTFIYTPKQLNALLNALDKE